MKRWMLFTSGFMMSLTSMSVALGSVPSAGRVTDDTAIYQKLSDIQVPRQGKLDFDGDISRLSRLEARYHEELPSLNRNARLTGPMNRIAAQKYKKTVRR